MNIAAIAIASPLNRAPDVPADAVPAGFDLLLGMVSALPKMMRELPQAASAAGKISTQATVADEFALPPAAATLAPEARLADNAGEPAIETDVSLPPAALEAGVEIPVPAITKDTGKAHQGTTTAGPLQPAEEAPAMDQPLAIALMPPATVLSAQASPEPSLEPEAMSAERPILDLDNDADPVPTDAPISDLLVLTKLPEAPQPAVMELGAARSPSVPPQDGEAAIDDPSAPRLVAIENSARPARAPMEGSHIEDAVKAPADAATISNTPDGLPFSLLTQVLPSGPSRIAVAGQSYGGVHGQAAGHPVVHAQPGQIGREMGVEIARQVAVGRDEVLIRLDPAEMGRIDVRLSFDREGGLRAVMAADSPAALDMLRREAGELTRALTDAGVRADPQSFRFDSRGGDAGQSWQRGGQPNGEGRATQNGFAQGGGQTAGDTEPPYRPLRTSGRVDLMA